MRAGKYMISVLAVAALTVAAAGQSMAAGGGPGVQAEKEQAEADRADQAIVVDEEEGFRVTVSYYKKNTDGTWNREFCVPGIYGRNGGTDDKKEGDGKTPYGTYRFTMAFGIKKDPGSILPYRQLEDGDYWVDDSDSTHYNKLVNTGETVRDWDSAEHMSAQGAAYHYGLALNYNESCTPGKGSAIFLHCYTESNDSGSAGCIRIPEERMEQLIQSVTEDTRIVIREKGAR